MPRLQLVHHGQIRKYPQGEPWMVTFCRLRTHITESDQEISHPSQVNKGCIRVNYWLRAPELLHCVCWLRVLKKYFLIGLYFYCCVLSIVCIVYIYKFFARDTACKHFLVCGLFFILLIVSFTEQMHLVLIKSNLSFFFFFQHRFCF